MITSIQIQNFRCFGSTKATGFSRINLFGGRNNAGKTALLEALLLMGRPSNKSILKLLSFRMTSKKMIEEMPERAWDNFFHQQKKENTILLDFNLDNISGNRVSITCDEDVSNFINLINGDTEIINEDILEFAHHLENANSVKSSLKITSYVNEKELHKSVFVASSGGSIGRGIEHTFIDTHFIPANSKINTEKLATEFSNAKYEGKNKKLLEVFQIIDSSIEEFDVFSKGEWTLHLKRDNENYMPISLFGDAMNKVADIVLRIINNENSILLIDEIENGIHYENQEDIWRILFDLCETYKVQLFATTHSYEMIEAFKDCIKKRNNKESASYFEMSRHPVSNQINIQKIPIYSLEDKLNQQKPIRGEQKNKRKSS